VAPYASHWLLFAEGVIAVEKDSRLAKHHVLDVPNIHAIDALKSLKSKAFVREIFNWQWHYYFLTDEGVAYLRTYLHLDENVVPATLKKSAKTFAVREPDRPARGGFGRGDKGVAPGEFKPRFGGEGGYRERAAGGFGRGRRPEGEAAPAAAPEATA
jgi:small subunit ribosomal protein S10e